MAVKVRRDEGKHEKNPDPDHLRHRYLNSNISFFGAGGKQSVFYLGEAVRAISKRKGKSATAAAAVFLFSSAGCAPASRCLLCVAGVANLEPDLKWFATPCFPRPISLCPPKEDKLCSVTTLSKDKFDQRKKEGESVYDEEFLGQ